jgi:hypothetical protein
MTKALAKLKTNKGLLHSLSLSARCLFINVFVVSLFSYHSLFFIFPTDLWKKIKHAISKSIIPFNGGAYTYTSLVCAKKLFSIKPALKDIWAFNLSLLAVRSRFFSPTHNYHRLPHIKIKNNMHISDHRDAAAVDFWRSRNLPDGTLVPLAVPTSTEVYKVLIDDVYLEEAAFEVSGKVSRFLSLHSPSLPPTIPLVLLKSISDKLALFSHVPQFFLGFHMSLLNKA